jgi:hypothetical protein
MKTQYVRFFSNKYYTKYLINSKHAILNDALESTFDVQKS